MALQLQLQRLIQTAIPEQSGCINTLACTLSLLSLYHKYCWSASDSLGCILCADSLAHVHRLPVPVTPHANCPQLIVKCKML